MAALAVLIYFPRILRMAALRNRQTRQFAYLRAAHVFGRNRDKADSVLFNLDASQIHASIRWNGTV